MLHLYLLTFSIQSLQITTTTITIITAGETEYSVLR